MAPLTRVALVRLQIAVRADVEQARRDARALGRAHGFGDVDTERLGLAISELATNLLRYARGGEITVQACTHADCAGVAVESRDRGPGIPNIAQVMEDGFSTGGGLGNGLPAVRRLLDGFEIESGPDGTRITASLCPTSH